MPELLLWLIAIVGELLIVFGTARSFSALISAIGFFMIIDVLIYAGYSGERGER